jgi:hypothetical protein
MANVTFISGGHEVQMTVGCADISGAIASASTNIVTDVSSIALPYTSPPNYMGADSLQQSGKPTSISGFATHTPGMGTFYYTIWMNSNPRHNYTDGIKAVLTVLQILP